MIRNFFVMLSVLFFAAGCAPSNWKVVRQAKPNPFKSGAPAFKATAIDFGSAQMAGVAKTMNKKKFKTDLSFLSRHYRKALLRSMNGKGVKIFTGKANPGVYVLRAVATTIDPGSAQKPSMIELKVQILKNNRIQDVITVKSSTKFEKAKSVSTRMQMDGKNLGEYVGKYLSKRLGK